MTASAAFNDTVRVPAGTVAARIEATLWSVDNYGTAWAYRRVQPAQGW